MNEEERQRDPETLFETPLFRVVRKSYETPDGRTHVRQIVYHPGAVAILPILDDGTAVDAEHALVISDIQRVNVGGLSNAL